MNKSPDGPAQSPGSEPINTPSSLEKELRESNTDRRASFNYSLGLTVALFGLFLYVRH